MANAKKLPSGSWRTLATKIVNGKKVSKSFTVDPKEFGGDSRKAQKKSEQLAREWQLEVDDEKFRGTIKQAMINYIEARTKVLSPTTILNYKKHIPVFESIWDVGVQEITKNDIQRLVNDWSDRHRKATIRTRIGFLRCVLTDAGCDRIFKIRYPKDKSLKKVKAPEINEVKLLIEHASDEMRPIIYLAAFGSLRCGEVAALKQKDISRDMNTVTINADMALTEENTYVRKPPKTEGSVRTIALPKFIIESLPESDDPEDFVFTLNPNQISCRFKRLRNTLGINCSFHSLRHFAASFRSDLGIPLKYIEEVGGWTNSRILKDIYDNKLDTSRKQFTQKANQFIVDNFYKEA